MLGVPVVRPKVTETTALGAAYLAGLALGYYPDRETIAKQWAVDEHFEPSMKREQRDALLHDWRRALERAKNWAEG
jgi:glycerol kinase